jgi:hypothetical protein
MFQKLDLFPSLGEGIKRPPLLSPHERVNINGVSPTPEDRKRSSFQDIAFYSYLQFHTMDKVLKPSNS